MGEVEFSHLTAVALSVNIQMGKTFPTLLTIFSKKYSSLKIEEKIFLTPRKNIMTAFEMRVSENLSQSQLVLSTISEV